jgi:dTDP-4-amino-4,6-dideoxygalactose transaminase
MGQLRVRYGGVVAGEAEIAAVAAVMRGQGWACGPVTRDLEQALAGYMGVPHAVAVSSGTSGLLAAMRCLPPGSGVVMPALQFPTLYSAAIWCGLRPILADISLTTLNMTAETLEKALAGTDASAAALAVAFVHVAGNPAGIADVAAVCEERGLILVEDCCEAFGSTSGGQKAGTFGDISVISTHAAHHVTTAVGGAAFTTRDDFARKMRRLRDWGRDIDGSGSYHFLEAGLNLQPSDIQAAIGLVQMRRLEEFGAARRRNYAALSAQLADVARLPGPGPEDDPSWFALPMLTRNRDEVAAELALYGIETRHLLCGNLARQPLAGKGGAQFDPADYPNADEAWRDGLWLPVHPRHSVEDMTRAGEIAREILIGGGA